MSNAYRYVNEERAIEMERARDLAQDENHYLRQRVTELVAEVERLRAALEERGSAGTSLISDWQYALAAERLRGEGGER